MNLQITKHDGYKAITSVPGWTDAATSSLNTIQSTAQAYAYVPLIYRAVRLRCDSLASVPVKLHQNENEIDWPFKGIDATDVLWKTEAARLLAGASYWLKIGKGKRIAGLQWLNPFTMTVSWQNGVRSFAQDIGSEHHEYTNEQIIYIPEFNPSDDVGPGIGSVDVALNDAGLMRYMSRFASAFFEGGAMPVVLLGIEGNPSDTEIKKTEAFFKRATTGLKNFMRVLGIRAGLIHPTVLTPPLKDLAMPELNDQARRAIAAAFGIPQTMLEDAANYATAESHEKSFWRSTVQPSGNAIVSAFNRQLWGTAVPEITMELAFESLDVFQQEESERAASLSSFIDFLTKCPTYELAKESAVNFGYELTDELLKAMKAWYAEKEKKAEEIQQNVDNAQDAQDKPIEEGEPNDDAATVNELRAWRRKAMRKMKAGKPAGGFESEYIPAGLSGAIEGQLEAAKTQSAVDEIFRDAIEGLTHGRS